MRNRQVADQIGSQGGKFTAKIHVATDKQNGNTDRIELKWNTGVLGIGVDEILKGNVLPPEADPMTYIEKEFKIKRGDLERVVDIHDDRHEFNLYNDDGSFFLFTLDEVQPADPDQKTDNVRFFEVEQENGTPDKSTPEVRRLHGQLMTDFMTQFGLQPSPEVKAVTGVLARRAAEAANKKA